MEECTATLVNSLVVMPKAIYVCIWGKLKPADCVDLEMSHAPRESAKNEVQNGCLASRSTKSGRQQILDMSSREKPVSREIGKPNNRMSEVSKNGVRISE